MTARSSRKSHDAWARARPGCDRRPALGSGGARLYAAARDGHRVPLRGQQWLPGRARRALGQPRLDVGVLAAPLELGVVAAHVRGGPVRHAEYRAGGPGAGTRPGLAALPHRGRRLALLLRSGELLAHRRTLDMRRGGLLVEWRHRDPRGRSMRLRALRAVSLAERSLGIQLVQFEMDQPGQVTFEAWLEVTNAGLDVVQIQPSLGVWRTAESGKRLAVASAAELRLDDRVLEPTGQVHLTRIWTWDAVPGQVVTFWRLVSFARGDSREHAPARSAQQSLALAVESGPRAGAARPTSRPGPNAGRRATSRRRRRCRPASAALRHLPSDQRRESGRRARVDRRSGADRRRLSGPRVLGHRELSAAVLYLHLARGGAGPADVSLPHAASRAGQGRPHGLHAARSTPGSPPTPARRPRPR